MYLSPALSNESTSIQSSPPLHFKGLVMTESNSKVAVITGASSGIGAALVKAYRRAGFRVVANSRSIGSSSDPDILAVAGDVAERATAERIFSQGADRFGRIDTLVNNAGIFTAKPFTQFTPEDWAANIGTNLA